MSGAHEDRSITRKEFISRSTAGAIGLGLGLAGDVQAQNSSQPKRSKVVLARDKSAMTPEGQKDPVVAGSLLEKALCAYTGETDAVRAVGRFIRPEDVVGIKMSVMMTATHPELVAGLAGLLVKLGVKEENIIVWDRDVAGRGIAGVYQRDQHFGFGENSVSRIINDHATALINFPGLKSHWLSGVGGALKNWCGAVTNINVRDIDTPYSIHGDSCADMGKLAAIEAIKSKTRLNLIDALQPLFEGGPQVNPAYLWPYGGLLLAEDPVALDAVGVKIIQARRDQHRGRPWPVNPPAKHVALADTRYNLGVSDFDRIDLVAVGEEEGRLI
ncbi:MAG: DUF362 domain-containing protein [Candidatus Glassbacteria bacterium]